MGGGAPALHALLSCVKRVQEFDGCTAQAVAGGTASARGGGYPTLAVDSATVQAVFSRRKHPRAPTLPCPGKWWRVCVQFSGLSCPLGVSAAATVRLVPAALHSAYTLMPLASWSLAGPGAHAPGTSNVTMMWRDAPVVDFQAATLQALYS